MENLAQHYWNIMRARHGKPLRRNPSKVSIHAIGIAALRLGVKIGCGLLRAPFESTTERHGCFDSSHNGMCPAASRTETKVETQFKKRASRPPRCANASSFFNQRSHICDGLACRH